MFLLALGVIHGQSDTQPIATGLPGDNFSLEGSLEMFQKATSPEDFEKLINTQQNYVNNLDLNEDSDIDYIKVIDTQDGNTHVFVLQVAVSETENQDIAIIALEKTGENEAILQIIGDEDIFGEEVIVEASDGEQEIIDEDAPRRGPSVYYPNRPFVVVNVWGWPCVRHVYAPTYRPWKSPWRWRVYPSYWTPWRPLSWNVYHPYRVKYYQPRVRTVRTNRIARANNIYRPSRATSTTVRTRYVGAHKNYKINRTKTTVTGPRGNSVTKKTTTVRNKNGKVKTKNTKVKRNKGN